MPRPPYLSIQKQAAFMRDRVPNFIDPQMLSRMERAFLNASMHAFVER